MYCTLMGVACLVGQSQITRDLKLACENIRFSSLFATGEEERLRLSGRNSILMTQTNVYIMNPVVMGFQT